MEYFRRKAPPFDHGMTGENELSKGNLISSHGPFSRNENRSIRTMSSASTRNEPPVMISIRTPPDVKTAFRKGGLVCSFGGTKRKDEDDSTTGTDGTDSDTGEYISDSLSSLGCDFPNEWATVCSFRTGCPKKSSNTGEDTAQKIRRSDNFIATETNKRGSLDWNVAQHVELKMQCAELRTAHDHLIREKQSLQQENKEMKRAASKTKEDQGAAQSQVEALRFALQQSQKKVREVSEERALSEAENERLRAENEVVVAMNKELKKHGEETRKYQRQYEDLQRIMESLLGNLRSVTETRIRANQKSAPKYSSHWFGLGSIPEHSSIV